MNKFCLPLTPNNVWFCLSVGHWGGSCRTWMSRIKNGHPVLLLALCRFSPQLPAAATGPLGWVLGCRWWHGVVWCAPHDVRELQILPGLPLPAVCPGLLRAGNGADVALGRKEETSNPALQPPSPASLAQGMPRNCPRCFSSHAIKCTAFELPWETINASAGNISRKVFFSFLFIEFGSLWWNVLRL